MNTQFPILTPTPEVTIHNGKTVTTSQAVATYFGKRHDDVLKKLRNLDSSPEFNARNFAEVDYTDTKGEKRPMCEMTKDGFIFLVMGFTGKKAAKFKEAYIAEFNRMEAELYSVPKYRPEAPELLSNDDVSHISYLVWSMSSNFQFNQSWSHGIWYALRQATGIPSPQRFEVRQIPLIAQECRRIYQVTSRLQTLIAEAERQTVRRILRKREDADTVLAEMAALLRQTETESHTALAATLERWQENNVNQFLSRSY